ncbi:MAG TPA: hypothetical protein VFU89_06100 [Rhabdochlamydiaceae bacterium]|nr:hypothetical protein [Rhabdochlamydiaceae bacterium]
MIKKFIVFSLIVTTFIVGYDHFRSDHPEFGPKDFCHPGILKRTPNNPNPDSKQLASEILKQRFTYLGCGGQLTAYESADHQYVIKFFNPRNSLFNRRKHLEKNFKRYAMSLKDLKEETGIVYNHFDASTVLHQSVEVMGKEGKLYQIPLEKYPFILQRKVELVLPYLDKLYKEGRVAEAKESARQIYALFVSRTKKGYRDHSQNLEVNYGFYNGKAVQIDPGRIRHDKAVAQNPRKEMERIAKNIKRYLSGYPGLNKVIDECLNYSQPSSE